MKNRDRLNIIKQAKESGYTGSYLDLFQDFRENSKGHIEAETSKEIHQGLEGASYGTSATLNFEEESNHMLEGRQDYAVKVHADGEYQGILSPGEEYFMVDTSSTVDETPVLKYGGIPIKQGNTGTGTVIPENPTDVNDPYAYLKTDDPEEKQLLGNYIDYIQSPAYREKMVNLGYEDIDATIALRVAQTKNTNFRNSNDKKAYFDIYDQWNDQTTGAHNQVYPADKSNVITTGAPVVNPDTGVIGEEVGYHEIAHGAGGAVYPTTNIGQHGIETQGEAQARTGSPISHFGLTDADIENNPGLKAVAWKDHRGKWQMHKTDAQRLLQYNANAQTAMREGDAVWEGTKKHEYINAEGETVVFDPNQKTSIPRKVGPGGEINVDGTYQYPVEITSETSVEGMSDEWNRKNYIDVGNNTGRKVDGEVDGTRKDFVAGESGFELESNHYNNNLANIEKQLSGGGNNMGYFQMQRKKEESTEDYVARLKELSKDKKYLGGRKNQKKVKSLIKEYEETAGKHANAITLEKETHTTTRIEKEGHGIKGIREAGVHTVGSNESYSDIQSVNILLKQRGISNTHLATTDENYKPVTMDNLLELQRQLNAEADEQGLNADQRYKKLLVIDRLIERGTDDEGNINEEGIVDWLKVVDKGGNQDFTGEQMEEGTQMMKYGGIPGTLPKYQNKGIHLPVAESDATSVNQYNPNLEVSTTPDPTFLENLTNPIRKRLADNLYPVDYNTSYHDKYGNVVDGGPLTKITRALAGYEDDSIIKFNTGYNEAVKERTDLLQILMGQDQKYNTIKSSKYIPTKGHEEGDTYYSSAATEREIANSINESVAWMSTTEPNEHGNWGSTSGSLAKMTLSMGEDEKGKYVSYYDKWDLQPFGKKGVLTNITNKLQEHAGMTPPKVYGRVYLKDVPNYNEREVNIYIQKHKENYIEGEVKDSGKGIHNIKFKTGGISRAIKYQGDGGSNIVKGSFPDQNAITTTYQESQNYPRIKSTRTGKMPGTNKSHFLADNDKDTAWPLVFQNEDGSWLDYSDDEELAYKTALERDEIYKFDSKKELIGFAREGNWKERLTKGDFFNIYKNSTFNTEDLKLTGYIPTSGSGVTIGQGFDIGQFNVKQLESMFSDQPDLLKKLKPYAELNTKSKVSKKGLKSGDLQISNDESEYINRVLFARNYKHLEPYLKGSGVTAGNAGELFQLRHWAGSLGGTPDKLAPAGTNYLWGAIKDKEYTTKDLHDAIKKTIGDIPAKEKKKGTARYNHLVKTLDTLAGLLKSEK